MILIITQYGIHQAVGVPHALTGITGIVGVYRLDRVPVRIGEVYQYVLWQVVHLVTDVTGRHDEVNLLRELAVEDCRLLGGGTHVITTQTVTSLETARLDIDCLHLLLEELETAETRILVTARLKELGEGSGKADGYHHDRVILRLAEQFTIELIAVGQFLGVQGTLEERVALCVLQVTDAIVRDEAARVLHTVALQSYRNVGVSVVVVEDIHDTRVLLTLTVDDDTLQVYQSVVDIMMQHHQCEEVVGRTAEVRVQNHLDRLVLLPLVVGILCLRAQTGTQAQYNK